MSREVTMPQLGMVQNTGIIVAWHKKPGEAVASDDVLMEVETDKATMEVPAGVSGFLAEIRAEAGSEVPVGDVVAVIADSADAAVERSASPPAALEPKVTPAPAAETAEPAAAPIPPSPAPVKIESATVPERVLASPKAKYVARERGIDLRALAAQGIPQPFHVADLDQYRAALTAAASAGAPFGTAGATVARAAFDALFAISGLEHLDRTIAFGAFAASAYRAVSDDPSAPITVACRTIPGGGAVLSDPDRGGLSKIVGEEAATDPVIAVFDLTGSRMSSYRPAAGASLQLSIGADEGNRFAVALAFDETRIHIDEAAAFLDAFLARIENPILHIV